MAVEDPTFVPNKNFKRDCFNVVVGMVWQLTLVALPMYIVIKEKMTIISAVMVLVITSFILKKNWWNKLEN